MKEVIVVGGGASGMIAAIVAARRGLRVCILERLNRVGKKILTTGNGRCNMTNTSIETIRYHSSSQIDLGYPLHYFGYKDTERFFMELGIMPLIEGYKVYPLSEQANSIVDVLRMELERLEVEVVTEVKVVDLSYKNNAWEVISESGEIYKAEKVIIATGGMTNSSLGCDGLGYQLLKRLGHHMTPTFPILVHVLSTSPYCKMMKGTKVKATASIYVEGVLEREEYGEVLFTEDGLSGPAIFQISRVASLGSLEGKKVKVTLDIMKDFSYDEVVSLLYNRIAMQPHRTIEELFIGMLHKRIVIPLLKCAQIASMHRASEELEYEEIARLAESIKAFPFEITGTRGYKFAQVTAGGINIEEVDLTTMASKKAKNLYITGEVLDVDGDCGGFNLQWAWSTGYLAGESVSKK